MPQKQPDSKDLPLKYAHPNRGPLDRDSITWFTANMATQEYSDFVHRQREEIPGLYGAVDFSTVPERLDTAAKLDDQRFDKLRSLVAPVFDNPDLLERVRNSTMTGDRVADAYAALIPQFGFPALIQMLDAACERGVENVENAPPELVDFIRAMENTPDWVDMDLVKAGARDERIPMASGTPFAIRGAFLATFLNKYAALPMTMTGTLSDEASAKRVFETASFFTATTLPGALDRHGKGFQAAAKVRLMHSMVRFHLLSSGKWDVGTYGIPIPQVDQMPAGTIGTFLMSARLLRKGVTEFTEAQRATVELSRYRCFLLGLPQDLLGETPREIIDLLMARHVTLREAYDDETCGTLVRGTMEANLFDRSSLRGKLHSWLENGFSRFVLINSFLSGDATQARTMGITFSRTEKLAAAIAAGVISSNAAFYRLGLKLPGISSWIDRRLNAKIARLLDTYGHADFVTDPGRYKVNT